MNLQRCNMNTVIITVVESNVFYEFECLWNKLIVNTGFEK